MSRMTVQIMGGVVVVLACLTVAIPIVVVHVGGGQLPAIPTGWWLAVFTAYYVPFSLGMWLMDWARRGFVLAMLAVASVLAPVLVLTAPQAGWTPILLVFNAAILTYLLPLRAVMGVVAVNTAVAATGAYLLPGGLFEVTMTALLYAVLQSASVFAVSEQLREVAVRKQLAEDHVRLQAATALLAESSRSEERLRIARELHDLVGHQLTVLALELEIASHRADGPAGEAVGRARELTRHLLGDVRSAVGEMRQEGRQLRETLEAVIAELPEPAVHLRIDQEASADEASVKALVRCVQEVVTNAIRHASAANVWIDVSVDDGTLRLEAHDDGVGAATFAIGNGLRGMRERLEALGGSVSFSGERGFTVRAEVPAA